MLFRSVHLPGEIEGTLYLHSMPGRRESWEHFEAELADKEIGTIACLNAFEEIEHKSAPYATVLKEGKLPCAWIGFPIPDFGVPQYQCAYFSFVRSLAKMIKQGNSILLHCAGGVGRTGMTGILLMRQLGLSIEASRKAISSSGSEPDTDEQHLLCSK